MRTNQRLVLALAKEMILFVHVFSKRSLFACPIRQYAWLFGHKGVCQTQELPP